MKNTFKISVILLILLTAGSLSLNAQQGMRGLGPDSTRMNMHRMGRMPMQDSLRRDRMDHRMGRMGMPMMPPMWGMHRPFAHGMWPGMGMWMPHYGMIGHGMFRDYGIAQGPGMRMIDRIPDLTDLQKKEIADLQQKHRDEMQNLRSDFQKKMQDERDSHRKEIMNVLTDEQKKWLKENDQMIPQPTEPPSPSSVPEAPKAPVM